MSPPHSTARFHASNRALFAAAAAASETTELSYRIADRTVRVRCAGPELVGRTAPAFRAVRDTNQSDTPDLTIDVWDSATSGIEMPRPPWAPDELRPLGLVRSYCDDRFHTAVDVHTASLSTFDAASSRGQFWLQDARRMAYWQSASPLRLILSWWASARGMQLTHAAAVGTADRAVLLVGGGGSGKSTTSLACGLAGLDFFGDDYCLVSPTPKPRVHGVYATAKLRPDALALLPSLTPTVRNAARLEHEKAILDLPRDATGQLANGAEILAVVAPRVTGRVALQPVSPGAGLRAMAPSTIFGLFGATAGSLAVLAGVAARVPAYELELGDDLDAVVDHITSLVEAA